MITKEAQAQAVYDWVASAAEAGVAQPAPARPQRVLSASERREFKERQAIRREGGLRKLSEKGFKAWLRSKYPKGSDADARRSHWEAIAAMPLHKRFLMRKEQSDFAKRFDRPLTLEERQRDFAALEQTRIIAPPIWRGSDAEYCAEWRDYERRRANPWWAPR